MSGQTAAIQQQEVPPPGSNDLKEQCTHDVVATPEVKVAANQGCNDNTSPSKSPNKKVEKSPDKTVEGKPKKLSSSNPSAEQPKQQPSPPHKDACAGDAKVADTASPASAKKEKKEHPEKRSAKESAATRVASAVEPRDATKSPTHTATKNAPPAADVAGAETPTKAVDTTKKQVDATAAAQEKSNKEGGSEQSPSSPSKKKKKSKSKNKKKRKSSNPESDPPAHAKPPESPDHNTNQGRNSSAATPHEVHGGKPHDEAKKASVNGNTGVEESSKDGGVESPTKNTSPKSTNKATAAAVRVDQPTPKENRNEKSEVARSDHISKAQGEKSPAKASNDASPSKSRSPDVSKSEAKIKSEASPSQSSSPNKKDAETQEKNQAANYEADDGAWETVEVKPRGRRGKGGSKKSPGGQNKTSHNNNSSNNNNGRNHSDHGSVSGTSHHGSSHSGGKSRRQRDRKKRNNNHNNHNSHNNHGNHNNHNHGQQQQNKMVKAVSSGSIELYSKQLITQILDVVDDEVARRGGGNGNGLVNGKQQQGGGNTKACEDNKRRSNINNSGNDKRSTASNSKQHLGQHQRNNSGGGQRGGVAASSPANPPTLIPTSSAKSLRDVLVGSVATPLVPTKDNPAKAQASNTANNSAPSGGSNTDQPQTKSSSKVKPGMSYRDMIEPPKQPVPVEPQPEPEPQPQPPKPKLNAWTKKLDVKPDRQPPPRAPAAVAPAATDKPSEKPTAESSLAPGLTPLTGNSSNPSLENRRNAKEEVSKVVLSIATDLEEESHAPSPPLSTLLAGPPASCSASSSVASSLEAPHGSRNRGGKGGEADVGYHLLNVCGQLSEEINTFMNRRALALDVRRRERSAVLSALGDTLGKIWPGQCCVEMYGSCATQLDLPSSDLDLVVCGLDDVIIDHTHPVGSTGAVPGVDQTMAMGIMSSSLHLNNSSNSFQQLQQLQQHVEQADERGEILQQVQQVPQECIVSSTMPQGQAQSISPDQQLSHSFSGSFQEGEEQQPSPHDSQLAEGSSVTVEGDQPVMMVDESADDVPSPMEEYPPRDDYHEMNQQEAVAAAGPFSPAGVYSYHSDMAVAGSEGYHTPGSYQATDEMGMGMVEGYQEYHQAGQEQFFYAPYNYVPALPPNAQRVLRLASELELQPWAVQVKAIPTATVPVVKMLADPSRLPGLAVTTAGGGRGDGNNWVQMQQHFVPQAGVAAGVTTGTTPTQPQTISPDQMSTSVQSQTGSPSLAATSQPPHYFPPTHPVMAQWRGTDIKNGLQPVDITFEGPEHGGIGSTTYSTRVVQDACDETGLPPESTPIVQVASVLKELLAQRRLNEPFSGGLSSYGLLLLLLAVLKDRQIIQEEMKKVEKQRMKVSEGHESSGREAAAAGSGKPSSQKQQRDPANSSGARKNNPPNATTATSQSSATAGAQSSSRSPGISDSSDKESSAAPSSASSKPVTVTSSSWASIAKKSNASTALTESMSTMTKSTNDSGPTLTAKPGANNQVARKESKENAKKASSMTKKQKADGSNAVGESKAQSSPDTTELPSTDKKPTLPQSASSNIALDGPAILPDLSQVTPSSEDDASKQLLGGTSCSNDIFEVLCSGELTSGKLLTHFLLFYGQHFDSQSTLIDINATHHPEYGKVDFSKLSPFIPRSAGGTIDPITGMYSVDPIVVYDPLEGAMDHNVSKRCYCWNNVRWVFAQAYMTVSSVVETSDQSTLELKKKHKGNDGDDGGEKNRDGGKPGKNKSNNKQEKQSMPSSTSPVTGEPILELLLSF